MSRRRIIVILRKEWQVVFTDLNNIMLTTLLPLIIVGEGIVYVWAAYRFGGSAILNNPLFQTSLEKFREAFPLVANLPAQEQLQLFLLQQFNFFLLLIPTIIAVTVAAFSIVDEKVSRSLEPLLATPVRTWELLLAKALSGAIPALIVTWISAVLFLIGVKVMGWGSLTGLLTNAAWYVNLFLLTPAIAILSFLLGVIGSSKAKDAKGALNLSVIIILPVFGLIAVQITGLIWFTPLATLLLSLGIVAVDLIVLRLAVRLFQREAIVVKWH